MTEWASYRLEDFLLFSAETYFRLFEIVNAAYWPLPLVTVCVGLGLIALAFRRPKGALPAAAISLALFWGVCGWLFFWESYSRINWVAGYVGFAFVLQVALLFLFALRAGIPPASRSSKAAHRLGLMLLTYAVALHPFLAPILGRPLLGAEVVGLAPDPTAIASLGLLLVVGSRGWTILLGLVPICWLLLSAVTLFGLDSWQWPIPLLAIGVFAAAPRRSGADTGAGERGR